MKETLMRQIIAKQDEYNKLLSDELDEVVTIAYIHGWRSNKFEQGKQMRDELADLNEQLKQAESEPKELAEIIEEEKCSRCKDISDELINWIKCV
jgi:vacuolar-type H+-ATPase subunit I/STV1